MALVISRLTTEYLFWSVETPNDLSTSTADVAFMASASLFPGASDWQSAEILSPESQPVIRILVGPGHIDAFDLTPSTDASEDYQVWIRINDNPESPVRRPGLVTVE